jgi:hypothetical protein
MLSAFQSEDVLMVDVVTTYDSHQDIPDSSIILVTFGSSALFIPTSPVVPSREEMEAERQQAFEGDSLSGYLGMVQSLPSNNVFTTVLQIFLVQQTSEERQGVSGVGVAAASFAVVFGSVFIGLAVYRRRRKQRRHRSSDKFLNGLKEFDVLSEGMTATKSNSGDCSLGTTDFGESERIEVTLCECDEDMEDLARRVLEKAEEEIVFQREKGHLFREEVKEGGENGDKNSESSGDDEDNNDDKEEDGELKPLQELVSRIDDSLSESESERSGSPAPDTESAPLVTCASEDSYGFSSLESPPSRCESDDEGSCTWSVTG